MRRAYTAEEIEFIRHNYGRLSCPQVAARLKRSLSSIYQQGAKLGLTQARCPMGPAFARFIREKNRQEWSDERIAAAWSGRWPEKRPVDRHTVGDWRRRLGIANVGWTVGRRARVAEKTREQARQAGLASLAEVRVQAFRDYATANGWPAELKPRAVQIMNCLYELGPQTRRQIAARIGMPWRGKKTMFGNGPGGSYLAGLIRLGLVVSQRKVAREADGTLCDLYSIPVQVVRGRTRQGESQHGCG